MDRLIAPAAGNRLHGLGQLDDRGDDAVGLPARHDDGDANARKEQRPGQGQQLGRHLAQAGRPAHRDQLAMMPPVAVDGRADHHQGVGGGVDPFLAEPGHPVAAGVEELGRDEDGRKAEGVNRRFHRSHVPGGDCVGQGDRRHAAQGGLQAAVLGVNHGPLLAHEGEAGHGQHRQRRDQCGSRDAGVEARGVHGLKAELGGCHSDPGASWTPILPRKS